MPTGRFLFLNGDPEGESTPIQRWSAPETRRSFVWSCAKQHDAVVGALRQILPSQRALAHLKDMIGEHPDAFHGSPGLLARARELDLIEPVPNSHSAG
jgi:hypothetical protein